MALDASRTINGDYGEVWMDGQWIMNAQKFEATGDIEKEDVKRSGTRVTGQKVTGVKYSGTLTNYKVTSQFIKLVGQVGTDRGKPFVTELIGKLDDPEAYGAERIRFKGVQFDKIPLMSFEVGNLVQEELPFTFSGFDLLDEIKQP
jgi:hypothetical protein